MDSKLLAGAYSKRYRYIESEQLETLSNGDLNSSDSLAKARRLSQETNKRRKLLIQKRKTEAAREEKRRQEILNKRHQEQKTATEKYQRCHVGTRPSRLSPSRRRGHSPVKSHVDIEEALRVIRGSSAPTEQSRQAIQRLHCSQSNGRDPLERSGVRASRTGSTSTNTSSSSHNRPLSGRPLDASMRAQLMERSLRNLTNSRSRFEQQLEQQQQLLVEQQQRSLREFNQAIRREIDADKSVQGMEDLTSNDMPPQRSESLSSLDSLEEANMPQRDNQSQGNSLQEHQAQSDFQKFQQTHPSDADTRQQQQQRRPEARPQSAKGALRQQPDPPRPQNPHVGDAGYTGSVDNSHIIGPIPQGYHSVHPVSSTPVIQGSLTSTQYHDSLDASQPDRRVAVGTALRLPQQPAVSVPVTQPIKQPPPTLQYDSQLLNHRRFDVQPHHTNTNNTAAAAAAVYNGVQVYDSQPESDAKLPEGLKVALAAAQNQGPEERAKPHIYAWTSPPPEESEPDHNSAAPQFNINNSSVAAQYNNNGSFAPQYNDNSSGSRAQYNNNSSSTAPQYNNSNSYSAAMVADRVMVTNVHPHTHRTISTAATTTCVYQTVAAPNREPSYTQAGMAATHHHQPSIINNNTHTTSQNVEIPKSQGQKPGSVVATSASTYHPGMTGLKLTSTGSSYADQALRRHQGNAQATDLQVESGKGAQGGSMSTITLPHTDPSPKERRVPVVEGEGRKEVRGILKKGHRDPPKAGGGGQTRFNVQDSLEIAKMHMKHQEHTKRKKAQKKGVRFADLHYPDELEEDTDSMDSMADLNMATKGSNSATDDTKTGTKGTAQRQRPASARVTTANTHRAASAGGGGGDSSRSRVPRVASAGPGRYQSAQRPKAAAHIIMSGEGGAQNGHHGYDAHKSQLDKKVMLINNNFMSRVPVYSSTDTAMSTATVYTVSGGNAATPTSSSAMYVTSDTGTGITHSGQGGKASIVRGKTSIAAPPQPTVLPSHSHFSSTASNNGSSNGKVVYNENGLRIDRTPTDDEINNLWMNMRTMLNVSEGGKGAPQSSASSSNEQAARPQVTLSHQYIDGASLGIPNGMRRPVVSKATLQQQPQTGAASKAEQTKNGYLQRFSLLQQRRAPTSAIGVPCRANNVVEQTVQPMAMAGGGGGGGVSGVGSNGVDPWHSTVSISYAPREEMSESMAGFLAAEQAVLTQGGDVRESRVMAAMESAQNQQEIYNSMRQKFARGGPSALSLEERQLLESLDKLNDRLKVVENRQVSTQQVNTNPANQIYVHGSGFRGQKVMTSQAYRRNSGVQRSTGRPLSARLLDRPYR